MMVAAARSCVLGAVQQANFVWLNVPRDKAASPTRLSAVGPAVPPPQRCVASTLMGAAVTSSAPDHVRPAHVPAYRAPTAIPFNANSGKDMKPRS